MADVKSDVWRIAMDLEIVAIARVDTAGRLRLGVDHHVPRLIENQQRAHVFGRRRAVEQHHPAQVRRQLAHARMLKALHDRLQRQVVDLKVARGVTLHQQ